MPNNKKQHQQQLSTVDFPSTSAKPPSYFANRFVSEHLSTLLPTIANLASHFWTLYFKQQQLCYEVKNKLTKMHTEDYLPKSANISFKLGGTKAVQESPRFIALKRDTDEAVQLFKKHIKNNIIAVTQLEYDTLQITIRNIVVDAANNLGHILLLAEQNNTLPPPTMEKQVHELVLTTMKNNPNILDEVYMTLVDFETLYATKYPDSHSVGNSRWNKSRWNNKKSPPPSSVPLLVTTNTSSTATTLPNFLSDTATSTTTTSTTIKPRTTSPFFDTTTETIKRKTTLKLSLLTDTSTFSPRVFGSPKNPTPPLLAQNTATTDDISIVQTSDDIEEIFITKDNNNSGTSNINITPLTVQLSNMLHTIFNAAWRTYLSESGKRKNDLALQRYYQEVLQTKLTETITTTTNEEPTLGNNTINRLINDKVHQKTKKITSELNTLQQKFNRSKNSTRGENDTRASNSNKTRTSPLPPRILTIASNSISSATTSETNSNLKRNTNQHRNRQYTKQTTDTTSVHSNQNKSNSTPNNRTQNKVRFQNQNQKRKSVEESNKDLPPKNKKFKSNNTSTKQNNGPKHP